MSRLLSQMEAVSHRFEELSIRLNQPETAADPVLFRRLMQEYHEAEPVVQAYQALTTAQDHLAQAKALLEGEALDPDFKEMVQQEISEKSQEVAQLENNLKILLLPKDVNDDKSVIMELRGGAGGEEAALFAHSLMRMYTMYVQSRGWELEVLNLNETELGGVKEAILAVNGAGAYNRLKYESGVHRVQRVPETETQGRIHTSTATVAVMHTFGERKEICGKAPALKIIWTIGRKTILVHIIRNLILAVFRKISRHRRVICKVPPISVARISSWGILCRNLCCHRPESVIAAFICHAIIYSLSLVCPIYLIPKLSEDMVTKDGAVVKLIRCNVLFLWV